MSRAEVERLTAKAEASLRLTSSYGLAEAQVLATLAMAHATLAASEAKP